MALRVSRTFNDISLSFTRHPVTNDILMLKNEDAIKKSVVNLVRTKIGERFFQPNIGSVIESSIFELSTPQIRLTIEDDVKNLLYNYEPRINVRQVRVSTSVEDYELDVSIEYDIVGLPFPTQNIEFILQPARI